MFSRTRLLLGDNIEKIHNSKVIVFGVGGVGGYVVEMLARSGINNITIVDYDTVDISNKNRQIIATDSSIGNTKVNVMKDRILSFNSDCKVIAINKKLLPENIEEFKLKEFDFVVDAIDMVTSKIALIKYAHDNDIPIISAMGVGNRLGIPSIKICDIYKTYNDGLSKVLRKKLKELDIKSHNVAFCENNTIENKSNIIGSISYYPATMGCMISAYVIEELLKRRK